MPSAPEPTGLSKPVTGTDVWQVVGAAGMPPFQNSWRNAGGSYVRLSYKLNERGLVHLRGVLSTTPGESSGSNIFTLPIAYAPGDDYTFYAIKLGVGFVPVSGHMMWRFFVRASGVVEAADDLAANQTVGLDFRCRWYTADSGL